MQNILIGCDPEVFVSQGGVFKSAYNLIKGDKQNPFKVRNGAVQVDGMALEFNTTPAASEDEFYFNVQDVFDQMKKMVPDYDIVVSPVADFDPEYMKAQPKEALILGCDPDYNAWTGEINPKPDGERAMRTASGHIHIGFTQDQDIDDPLHRHNCNEIAKQLDFYLGLPSLKYDDDTKRRTMYGQAGCVRYKPYGVEYRTLSNAWLQSESRIRGVYRNTMAAINRLIKEPGLARVYGDISRVINYSNKRSAEVHMKYLGIQEIV